MCPSCVRGRPKGSRSGGTGRPLRGTGGPEGVPGPAAVPVCVCLCVLGSTRRPWVLRVWLRWWPFWGQMSVSRIPELAVWPVTRPPGPRMGYIFHSELAFWAARLLLTRCPLATRRWRGRASGCVGVPWPTRDLASWPCSRWSRRLGVRVPCLSHICLSVPAPWCRPGLGSPLTQLGVVRKG